MADTFTFDLVSPERRLAQLDARSVRIPGAEGDMTAMPDHAPLITTLRPGVVAVETDGGTEEFVVTSGFAEIDGDGATILAENARPKGEVDQEYLNRLIEEAQEKHSHAKSGDGADDAVDAAAKFVADLVAVGDEIGISTSARAPAP